MQASCRRQIVLYKKINLNVFKNYYMSFKKNPKFNKLTESNSVNNIKSIYNKYTNFNIDLNSALDLLLFTLLKKNINDIPIVNPGIAFGIIERKYINLLIILPLASLSEIYAAIKANTVPIIAVIIDTNILFPNILKPLIPIKEKLNHFVVIFKSYGQLLNIDDKNITPKIIKIHNETVLLIK